MKLEVSKRDAYIMAETLWEAAMDLDIAAKGNRERARICARIGDPVAYAPKLARLEREITRMERRPAGGELSGSACSKRLRPRRRRSKWRLLPMKGNKKAALWSDRTAYIAGRFTNPNVCNLYYSTLPGQTQGAITLCPAPGPTQGPGWPEATERRRQHGDN